MIEIIRGMRPERYRNVCLCQRWGAAMRWDWLLSAGAVLLAFLGSQHHNLMMLLFAVGLGNVGASLMTSHPLVREAMIAMSLVMAGVIGYQISRPNRPAAARIIGALSIMLTLGIAGLSLMHAPA